MTDKQGLRSEPRYIVDKTGQIHYSPFDGYVFGNERKSIEPGQSCPTCERRMPYPKRESSPVTKTRSYRVPLDEERTSHMRYLRRCFYCGSPSLGPTCREHSDLLVADDFSPTRRGAA